jgi:hypothetical protein
MEDNVMKYVVKWYVSSRDESTYMGEDHINASSLEKAKRWADDNCDGFDYIIDEGGTP